MRNYLMILTVLLGLFLAACTGGASTPATNVQEEGTTEEVEEPSDSEETTETATEETAEEPDAAEATEETTGEATAESAESGEGATGEAASGGQLVTFASSDPGTLDPAAFGSYDQTLIAPNIVEGLFRLSPDGQSIEPGIAESYEVSDDGTVWTFTLRPDAVFHNGDPIAAQDFKYSFERVLNPDIASPKAWMLEGVVGAVEYLAGDASEVSGIVVVDEQTLEITLAEPLGFFNAMLANPALAVVSQAAVEEFGEDFGQNVVSAGPFMLGNWNINQDIEVVAFDDYWNGRPYLDSVLFRIIGDENTRVLEFDSGNLDVTWVPPAHWGRFTTDEVFKDELGWAETFHTDFLALNQGSLGSDPLVRQAICHAIDREAAVASLQGRASAAQGILPPGLLGFDPEAELCSYDPERARELLAEAGYPDGIDESFDLVMPPWNNLVVLMEIYQANLAEVGIQINLRPLEFGPYTEALDNGSYDLAWMYRVADYADPDSFYYPLLNSENIGGGGNVARYSNPDVDLLLVEGRQSIEEADRLASYAEVDAAFAEDLPYIPLTHNIYVDVHQPWVEGYVPSPMDTHMYQNVWVSDEQE